MESDEFNAAAVNNGFPALADHGCIQVEYESPVTEWGYSWLTMLSYPTASLKDMGTFPSRREETVCVCSFQLGSILEAKPLHQGQKTRILGRGFQSCSHLYSTLPVRSPLTPRLRPRSLVLGEVIRAGVSAAHPRRTI